MGILSDSLKNGVVGSTIRNNTQSQRTIGYVLSADERNNWCKIRYTDTNGIRRDADKIAVDLNSKNWFPSKGDLVLLDISNKESGLILSPYTDDYNRDIRSTQELKCDILNDGDGSYGGSIL